MDSEDIPSIPTFKEQAGVGQGVAGPAQKNKGGRPRKQAPAGDVGTMAGFSVPAKPQVREQAKQDPRKFVVLPIRAITDKNVTRQAFRVLAAVCSYANRNGFTWVAQDTLAADLGITQQSLSQQIVVLKQQGYLEETAKAYWGKGPTARSSTMRVIFDPTLSTEDVIARSGSAEQDNVSEHLLGKDGREVSEHSLTVSNNSGELVDSTSFQGEVVNRKEPTKADLQRLLPSLIAEVQARYRSEGLPVPVGDRLAREVADLTSAKQRSGTLN